MASEGTEESRAVAVAKVATRLFGSEIGPDAVIDESLQRATDDTITLAHATAGLADVLKQPIPANLDDEQLRKHPLSVWAELALGLDDGLELKRKKPIPFEDAVKRLADDSRVDQEQCRKHLEDFLTLVSLGPLPFTLLLPYADFFWTGVLTVLISLIIASAFASILIYAIELVPERVGLIGGLFYGLNFGLAGIAAAILGGLADSIGIESVYQLCAFLPLAGLLTWFLPRIEDSPATSRKLATDAEQREAAV